MAQESRQGRRDCWRRRGSPSMRRFSCLRGGSRRCRCRCFVHCLKRGDRRLEVERTRDRNSNWWCSGRPLGSDVETRAGFAGRLEGSSLVGSSSKPFGRGRRSAGGLFNSNDYFRVGWSGSGSARSGYNSFGEPASARNGSRSYPHPVPLMSDTININFVVAHRPRIQPSR